MSTTSSSHPTRPDGKPLELPWPQPSSVWSTYDLHCHCGAIRYSVKLSPPLYKEEARDGLQYPVGSCDCSFCQRNGYLCIHPLAENVEFTRGLEHKAEYLFGEKKNAQWFCRRCGSVIATDIRGLMETMGQESRLTVNARMLKAFDIDRLKIKEMKGMKDFGGEYDPETLESEVR